MSIINVASRQQGYNTAALTAAPILIIIKLLKSTIVIITAYSSTCPTVHKLLAQDVVPCNIKSWLLISRAVVRASLIN